ncbi:MAG TPA: glucoamylase family protein, partial [Abditibacteriaceae bacterium]|nr:glucoamylase family protein [Abditibacteriaceae bacterium]
MTDSALVLGFLQKPEAATEILRQLRRGGFRRAVAITNKNGRISVNGMDFAGPPGAVLGGAGGYWIGALFPPLRVARALTIIAGAVAGWAAARKVDRGVTDAAIARYKKWLVRGETLILVPAPMPQVARVLALLGELEDGPPTTFVVRPQHLRALGSPEEPLRLEPLTSERLREHAGKLARRHGQAAGRQRQRTLLRRLRDNERVIADVTRDLAEAARLGQPVSLSAEWLLDNIYNIQGQIIDVRRNLSGRFYSELPVVAGGELEGLPRVYAIAVELVARTDSRIDRANLTDFVAAYQEVAPLSIGELWALPMMLRIALVENLRRLVVRVDHSQRVREQADFWANRLRLAVFRDADKVLPFLADLALEQSPPSPHFADRLVSHLYDEEAALLQVQGWLEGRLKAPLADIMQGEQRRQAADQASVSNAISSLRHLNELDWREAFEELSLVERLLRDDPAQVYSAMDFATRDRYRHEIERIARGSGVGELDIARRALEAAGLRGGEQAPATTPPPHHVGYYLIDGGQAQLEAGLGYRAPLRRQVTGAALGHPELAYLGGVGAATASALCVLNGLARRGGGRAPGVLRLLGLLPASELAVQLVNYLVTRVISPRPLPKMDFEHGIPDEFRTIVVVPMLLLSPDAVREEINRLEVHYLANADPNLRFALLADFRDAPAAQMPEDAELMATAVRGIQDLNERHAAVSSFGLRVSSSTNSELETPNSKPFLLFHRERRWCESEACWMGWERKRGKLEELNCYLMGEGSTDPGVLHVVAGDVHALQGVRFVITLDADAELPHNTARRLVESMAHPLNRPVLSAEPENAARSTQHAALPVRGYTIIQPRVGTSLPSATATRFSRLFTDASGSDPYTHVISDVYQDLFGESSYYGKGIYDLEAFHRALSGRFPPSTLLSHDLIEGAHARTGLASDIEFFDQFPPNYLTYSKRQHRWIRGDWQIAQWLTNRVPSFEFRVPGSGLKLETRNSKLETRNPLSLINRWKIADNLRRSLLPPAAVALLVGGWLVSPGAALAASLFVGLGLALPALLPLGGVLTAPAAAWSQARNVRRNAGHDLWRAAVTAALLPHQAGLALDAIARTCWRRLVSGRRLLEWETTQVSFHSAPAREAAFLRRLGGSSLFALTTGLVVLTLNPLAFGAAAPYLMLWTLAPLLVKWLDGGRIVQSVHALPEADRLLLRRVARQTWRYFDDFVGPQINWLPPDNYQESLNVELAQRTSPTNIGMWLLAVLAAHDFGYVPLDEVIGRTLPSLTTLDELERHEGHLLNWYNAQTLEPLRPRYVSTVDSGNLLACLWTLAQGCRESVAEPLIASSALRGLQDTLALLQESLADAHAAGPVGDALRTLEQQFTEPPSAAHEVLARLRAAVPATDQLTAALSMVVNERPPSARQNMSLQAATTDPRFLSSASGYWAAQVGEQLRLWLHAADRYLQWLEMLAAQPEAFFAPLGEAALAYRRDALAAVPSLEALGRGDVPPVVALLEMRARPNLPEPLAAWLEQLSTEYSRARWLAGEMLADAAAVVDRADKLADEMRLAFLYDAERNLFSVGYNVDDKRLDGASYGLLASECRLTSFIAIARGDVPPEHWWALGRRYAAVNGQAALQSWSGTMFEYLMPLLLTRSFTNSLLDEGCRTAVAQQIRYGRQRRIPWGLSEAAFSELDTNRVYQYKAFGVPGLGLQRGHENDMVVSPYSSVLALSIDPRAAVENLKRLAALGARGDYGFYESIDFSRQNLGDEETDKRPTGERGALVRTYMVHHQGMSLLALANLLLDNVMQNRFHSNPYVQAATPLLYERIPATPPVLEDVLRELMAPQTVAEAPPGPAPERFQSADTPLPRVQLFSNGQYSVMVTNAGGGYSRWQDFDITRWRADTTRDNWGTFCYVRDVESSVAWSVAHQPLRRAARRTSVEFKSERVEFRRRDAEIETVMDVVVSPEDDAEVRRLTLINHSSRTRYLEVTSYAELALAPHAADRSHPAFNKLFIQTAAIAPRDNGSTALLAWRRPRSTKETPVWAAHVVAASADGTETQYETDRARFLGRGRSTENPEALETDLSNTTGAVLDPIFSLRRRITIGPGDRVHVAFVTAAAASREAVVALAEKYAELTAVERAFEMAWTHVQLEMHHLRIQPEEGQNFQHLASFMMYPFAAMRAPARRVRQNTRGQASLWAYGISGDLPIMVVMIEDEADVAVVRQALLAHTYWRLRGFKTDLVILNDEAGGYQQNLSGTLSTLIQSHTHYTGIDQPGGVFLRSTENLPPEDVTLLLASARVVLVAARGALAQQLNGADVDVQPPPRLILKQRHIEEPSAPLPFMELPYFNGLGGFTGDGREYAIYMGPGARPPAPWINVMANPDFGTLVSESGQGFSWFGNSQSNRITPWGNDPVSDPPSEAIYIRDEDTGVFWTPTPTPVRELDAYRARHGQGYTVFEHNSHAVEQELVTFVPTDQNVRIQRLRLRNRSSRRRRLSVTVFHELVLGTTKEETQSHIVTAWDAESR